MKVSQRKHKQKIHHYWLQQDKQHQYVIFTIWEEMFLSGRLKSYSNKSGPYAIRGGRCYDDFAYSPAGFRRNYSGSANGTFGFRLTLFM